MRKIFFFLSLHASIFSVQLGIDLFFQEGHFKELKGKKIGIITNHTGVDSNLCTTIDKFQSFAKDYQIVAFFSPEHGLKGQSHASEKFDDSKMGDIPIYSLHGKNRRPTKQMLKDIDVLIYDIQDLGSRPYTYSTTLFYAMEEAAKNNIKVIVLDRPNPINGIIVDGPMLDDKFRSFLGYVNVPYCHGMTIGELANFFNKEYGINCDLQVIAMKGWKRSMSFKETNLNWIPTSPNIPEADTPYYYPSTGILGELKILSIGIGYTLPFKIIGAPWIDGKFFAQKLNEQNLTGVKFIPFYFKPFFGLYKNEECEGVKIIIEDPHTYEPISVQYMILGLLKSLYPKEFMERLESSKSSLQTFNKVNGTDEVYKILVKENFPAWKLIDFERQQKKSFLEKREKYLFKDYP